MKRLFWISFFIAPAVHAGLGQELRREEILPQQCFLDFGTHPDRFTEICSGVLVDETTIVTAAHCVADGAPKAVRCGPAQHRAEISEIRLHPQFQEKTVIENVAYLVNDIAHLHLKTPLPNRGLKVARIEEVPEKAECAFFGYSKLSMQPRAQGSEPQFGWRIPRQNLSSWSEYRIVRSQGLRLNGSLSEVGDSGGPLACRWGRDWVLVGVASARDFKYQSLFAPVVDEAFPLVLKEPSVASRDQARLEETQFRARARQKDREQVLTKMARISLLQDLVQNSGSLSAEALELRAKEILFSKPGGVGRLKSFRLFKLPGSAGVRSIGDLIYNYLDIHEVNLEAGTVSGRLFAFGPSDNFSCHGDLECNQVDYPQVTVQIKDLEIYWQAEMPASLKN